MGIILPSFSALGLRPGLALDLPPLISQVRAKQNAEKGRGLNRLRENAGFEKKAALSG
jgi:hypothetical protein